MNLRSFGAVLLATLAPLSPHLRADTATAVPAKPAVSAPSVAEMTQEKLVTDKLSALVEKVRTKIQAGAATEAALAPELKEFDALRAEYAGQKNQAVAMVGLMEARLYLEVLNDTPKGVAILKQDAESMAGTPIADKLTAIATQLEQKAAADSRLAVGKPFPTFNEKDLDGAPLNLASYRGKVVLVDFWATWCPPCRAELPNVVAAYKKYHDKGFEIIGVSLDNDRAKLTSFMKEHGMTWKQYYDGMGWNSKLVASYGVDAIPATFLLDANGNIAARDLRGPALEAKLAQMLPAAN